MLFALLGLTWLIGGDGCCGGGCGWNGCGGAYTAGAASCGYGCGCAGWNGYGWGTPWGIYWTMSAVEPSWYGYYPYFYGWPGTTPLPGAAAAAAGAPARVVVRVPEGAALFIVDRPWALDPVTRAFTSPPLQPGATYRYTLKAELRRDGRTLTENKSVTVHAGDEVTVDFSRLGAR